jgi:hypothetical protein
LRRVSSTASRSRYTITPSQRKRAGFAGSKPESTSCASQSSFKVGGHERDLGRIDAGLREHLALDRLRLRSVDLEGLDPRALRQSVRARVEPRAQDDEKRDREQKYADDVVDGGREVAHIIEPASSILMVLTVGLRRGAGGKVSFAGKIRWNYSNLLKGTAVAPSPASQGWAGE